MESDADSEEEFYATVSVQIVGSYGWPLSEGLFEPYCVCEIPHNKKFSFQTPVADGTIMEPYTWNHTHEFLDFDVQGMLSFSVWAAEQPRDVLLGRIALEPYQFIPDGFDGDLALKAVRNGAAVTLRVKIDVILDAVVPTQPGTTLFCVTPTDIFAIAGSRKIVGRVELGQQIKVAGKARKINGEWMVPIRPTGAVDLACFDTKPPEHREVKKDTQEHIKDDTRQEDEPHPVQEDDTSSVGNSTASTPRSYTRRASRKRLQEARISNEMQQAESSTKAYRLRRLFTTLAGKARLQRELELRAQRERDREAAEKKIRDAERKKMEAAAIKVQSAWRGQIARLRVEAEKRAATVSKLLRDDATRREREAKMNDMMRRREREIARQRLQEMYSKKRLQFAIKIQSLRRGQLGRREAHRLRSQKVRDETWKVIQAYERRKEEEAVIRIQRAWRWISLRRAIEKHRKQVLGTKRQQKLKIEREKTAQRMFKLQEERKLNMVVKIQSAWRGRKAREEYRRLMKEKEKLQYEREVIRLLELRKIREGAKRTENDMNTSDDLRIIRDMQRQKEEDITRWLQEEEEVWRWCLEQESRYAALRRSVEGGADGNLSKWQEEEALQWQSVQRGDAPVNLLRLIDGGATDPRLSPLKSAAPLPPADVLRTKNSDGTFDFSHTGAARPHQHNLRTAGPVPMYTDQLDRTDRNMDGVPDSLQGDADMSHRYQPSLSSPFVMISERADRIDSGSLHAIPTITQTRILQPMQRTIHELTPLDPADSLWQGISNISPKGVEERRRPQQTMLSNAGPRIISEVLPMTTASLDSGHNRHPNVPYVATEVSRDDVSDVSKPEKTLSHSVLSAEEQRCREGLQEVLDQKREQITKRRWALAQRRQEHLQFRLLVKLGAENQRCHECDKGLASLQMLLQALEGICRISHELYKQRGSKEVHNKTQRDDTLRQLMDLLAGAALVDPMAQEMANEILKELDWTTQRQSKDPEPATPPPPSAPVFKPVARKAFEGQWAKEGSSSRYLVKGEQITFLDTGAVHEFQDLGGSRCAMDVLGDIFQGRLLPGGSSGRDRIQWSNGSSAWIKEEERVTQVTQSLHAYRA